MPTTMVALRLDPDRTATLDRLAEAAGTDRSAVLRAALDAYDGTAPVTPAPLTLPEALAAVEAAAARLVEEARA